MSFDLIVKHNQKIELYIHSILIIQSYKTHTHTQSERETHAHPLTTPVSQAAYITVLVKS